MTAWPGRQSGGPRADEVKVVLLYDSPGFQGPAGVDVVVAGDDYDEVVKLIEWSDKVVAW